MARREILVADVDKRRAETVGVVFQDASALDDVLADYDKTLDDVSDALGDAVTFRLREQGRSSFVKSAMDGAIARGDLGTVDALLSDRSPYRQYISPEASTVYRGQLAKARNTRAKLTAGQSNIRFAEANGIKLTDVQKLQMLGAPPPVDNRTPGERNVAAVEAAGFRLTDVQKAQMLGAPPPVDNRTPGERSVAAAEAAGIRLTDKQRAQMLGAPEPPPPSDYEVALRDEATRQGVSVAGLSQADKDAVFEGVYGDGGKPFPGKTDFERLQNYVIPRLEAYATGGLPPVEVQAFEASVVRLAADRTNSVTGEITRGSIPVDVLRALDAQGKTYDANRNVIMSVGGAEAPAAGSGGGQVPFYLRPNPDAGLMNGAPPGTASQPDLPTGTPKRLSDAEILDKMASYAQGAPSAPADLAMFAGVDLFSRADDIAGPTAMVDRGVYSMPYIGPMLTSPDTTQAEGFASLLVPLLARAQQQSPRFAVSEFTQLMQEAEAQAAAKFWDNPDRYRQGLATLDMFLASIENKGQAFVESGNAPKAEKARVATVLNDVGFVRDGLGVKHLPHPKTEAEVRALPPGTVFIFNHQVETRKR
jgi:hypothetical protein